jgi:hypothetical protein
MIMTNEESQGWSLGAFSVYSEQGTIQAKFQEGLGDNVPFLDAYSGEALGHFEVVLEPHPAYEGPAKTVFFLLREGLGRGDKWPNFLAAKVADAVLSTLEVGVDACSQMDKVASSFSEAFGKPAGVEFATEWLARRRCTALPKILTEGTAYAQYVAGGFSQLGTAKGGDDDIVFTLPASGKVFQVLVAPLGPGAEKAKFVLANGDEYPIPNLAGPLSPLEFKGNTGYNIRIAQPNEEIASYLWFVGKDPDPNPQIDYIASLLARQEYAISWSYTCLVLESAIPTTVIPEEGGTAASLYPFGPRWWAIMNKVGQQKCWAQ